jgi:hypothetical protein
VHAAKTHAAARSVSEIKGSANRRGFYSSLNLKAKSNNGDFNVHHLLNCADDRLDLHELGVWSAGVPLVRSSRTGVFSFLFRLVVARRSGGREMIRRVLLTLGSFSAIGADFSSLAIALLISFIKLPQRRINLINQEE